jgi:hypothetical protein
MQHAKKICRKIKCCQIPFFPKASIWIRCVQVYYSLLRFHQGKIKNRGNLKRAARRCNIPYPLNLSVPDILARLKACKKECTFYQEHRQRFCRKHLYTLLRIEKEQEDKEAFQKIRLIIQREHKRNFWQKLNYVTGKKQTRSATSIQVEGQGGSIMEHTTQESVERTIFSEVHKKHYTLTEEASICNRELFQGFGYRANTPASRAVLDGTYVAPLTSGKATRNLFTEIAAIRCLIAANSVPIVIAPEQWKQYWKVINEETSSSESGIHFGHYIVGSMSDIISHYHASRESETLAHTIQHYARENPWSHPGYKVMHNITDGGRLQCGKQDSLQSEDASECTES